MKNTVSSKKMFKLKIKKLILLIAAFTLPFSLLSCKSASSSMVGNRLAELNASNDDEIADTRAQNIIEALENKDKEALKKMFSSNALKEATDIDNSIKNIMEFYKGALKEKDGNVETSDSVESGQKEKKLEGSYGITTDTNEYCIYFVDKIVDTANSGNIGLYKLEIIKKVNGDPYRYWGNETNSAGIFINQSDDT